MELTEVSRLEARLVIEMLKPRSATIRSCSAVPELIPMPPTTTPFSVIGGPPPMMLNRPAAWIPRVGWLGMQS
jgi:hypothetical protein